MRMRGWRTRLEAVLLGYRGKPLEWGVRDCVTFAGDAVAAITGEDYIGDYRGKYTTPKAAIRLLRRDYRDLSEALAERFPEIHISEAATGDLVAVPADGEWGIGLGVVIGDTIAAYSEQGGLGSLPLIGSPNEKRRAFRVQ